MKKKKFFLISVGAHFGLILILVLAPWGMFKKDDSIQAIQMVNMDSPPAAASQQTTDQQPVQPPQQAVKTETKPPPITAPKPDEILIPDKKTPPKLDKKPDKPAPIKSTLKNHLKDLLKDEIEKPKTENNEEDVKKNFPPNLVLAADQPKDQ